MATDTLLDPVFQVLLDVREEIGVTRLGLTANQLWHHDPRHLLFLLARYKFVAKMLSGKKAVLEVGCGDAFGTRLVLQEVGRICATDIEPVFVIDVNDRMADRWRFDCRVHDMLAGPVEGEFDAAYSLDVIEHIAPEKEHPFLSNICQSLGEHGVLILGTPSLQSQVHASEPSRQGHINCKDHKELKKLVSTYFHTVFIFSMNDEVVHTGFYPMAHYLFAIGVGKKNQ
ncbi:MAG: class I SAM-dependent methyltransferase [Desulfomonile tiedjei]|nr:class I SAM-dependent methyltransferase [Desulfomonile tiedjei]